VRFDEVALLLATNLVALWGLLCVLWAISVRTKDASIIDIFWGPACAFGAVMTYFRADGSWPRDLVLTALVTIWAARLAYHLARRNLGHGEDQRYRKMREEQGSDAVFARWSLVWVFGLQGLIAFIVSLPVQIGQLGEDRPLGIFAFLGIVVFAIGLGFESIGDAQLARFKRDPGNRGKLMTRGLWAWTRHPNYFGDAAVWAGLALIALEGSWGWVALLSPVVMTHFLVNVSGKVMLERAMEKQYPEYARYRASTSGFVPLPPKRG
jgi:steroid 5-alpha reductase family enzyme